MSFRPTSTTGSAPPLLSLQVLRALAALLVVIHHAGYDADTIAGRMGVAPFSLDRLFDWGFGIHLFFVISGYIMVRTARGFGSARGSLVFLARRIIRVVPLYWLMTSLVLIGTVLAPGLLNMPLGGFDVVVESYAFIPVVRPGGELRPVLGQGWTLDYEMFFYGLFALSMLLPRKPGLTLLALTLAGLVAIGIALRPSNPILGVWTDELLLEFLFGLGIAVLAEAGLRVEAPLAVAGAGLGVVCAIAFGPLCSCGGIAISIRQGLPAAAIVGFCVLGPRWPASRPLLALGLVGDASYSLYLSHPFVIRVIRTGWLAGVPRSMPLALELGVSCLGAVAVALVLHRTLEAPMTNRLQRGSALARSTGRPILPDATSTSRDGVG